MPSKADNCNTTLGGTGSIADRELAYLTGKTAVGKSFADKAVATGRVPRPYLGTYP